MIPATTKGAVLRCGAAGPRRVTRGKRRQGRLVAANVASRKPNGAGEKTEKTRRISLLRSGQKRFIGFVMTGRHPCSPREVTLSALPAAAYRAGRDIFSIIPQERQVAAAR